METARSPNSFSLLIVEDDKAVSEDMARMVTSKFPNCTTYLAHNGIEGMELFKQHTPKLVLTDVNMPVMEGFEMIREISAIKPDTSFIVLTAYAEKLPMRNSGI